MDLFRFRFQYSNDKKEKKKFLEDNNLHYEPVSVVLKIFLISVYVLGLLVFRSKKLLEAGS